MDNAGEPHKLKARNGGRPKKTLTVISSVQSKKPLRRNQKKKLHQFERAREAALKRLSTKQKAWDKLMQEGKTSGIIKFKLPVPLAHPDLEYDFRHLVQAVKQETTERKKRDAAIAKELKEERKDEDKRQRRIEYGFIEKRKPKKSTSYIRERFVVPSYLQPYVSRADKYRVNFPKPKPKPPKISMRSYLKKSTPKPFVFSEKTLFANLKDHPRLEECVESRVMFEKYLEQTGFFDNCSKIIVPLFKKYIFPRLFPLWLGGYIRRCLNGNCDEEETENMKKIKEKIKNMEEKVRILQFENDRIQHEATVLGIELPEREEKLSKYDIRYIRQYAQKKREEEKQKAEADKN